LCFLLLIFLIILSINSATFAPFFWNSSGIFHIKNMTFWALNSALWLICKVWNNWGSLFYGLLKTFLVEILAFETPTFLAFWTLEGYFVKRSKHAYSDSEFMIISAWKFPAWISSSSSNVIIRDKSSFENCAEIVNFLLIYLITPCWDQKFIRDVFNFNSFCF